MDKKQPKQQFYDPEKKDDINMPFIPEDSGHRFFLRANVLIIIAVFVFTMLITSWGFFTLKAKLSETKRQPSPPPIATQSPTPLPSPTPSAQPSLAPVPGEVFCTQDALECPDGSFVGRQPPTCEFASCPSPL